MVIRRYSHLNLSFEQAEQVYRFERERDAPSDTHHFSYWEEQDYMLDHFIRILSPAQLTTYKQEAAESIRHYEAELVRSDGEQAKWAAHFRELADRYKHTFLPAWFRDQVQAGLTPFLEKEKITYLRAEFRKYMDEEKKMILVNHYRHNRLFKPQLLQTSLWLHECNRLLGQYAGFKAKMDPATRAVADFLLEKYRIYAERGANFFLAKQEELTMIQKNLKAANPSEGKSIEGWHITITATPQEVHEQRIMQLLLMEPYNPNTAFSFT